MSIETVNPTELRTLIYDGQSPCILDVRTPAEFARVHAAGASLMPLEKLDPAAVAARRQGRTEPIYVICHSGSRAAKACRRLKKAGVGPVYCIEGGTVAWEQLGLPVERGDERRSTRRVISLERQVRIAAGSLVLLGLALAWAVHPLFLILCAFVGAGLVFAGVTDFCGMGILLGKMPWNRDVRPSCSSSMPEPTA
ncbi:MAG TPA: rhodanese-like domain-containing protein [Tepidisphaeraceae bacterium]